MTDVKCSCCDKPAIGYEAGGDRGMTYCEDHASKELLAMKPGEKYDERGDKLSWEFLAETGILVPEYRHRFLVPGVVDKSTSIPNPEGYWLADRCANVLMVHRQDIPILVRKGYLKSKEIDGRMYITYQSLHHFINMTCKWMIFLPIAWKLGLCSDPEGE